MQIEHNPHEKRTGNGLWWAVLVMVVLLWCWYVYFFDVQWAGIAIGVISGTMLASWANDVTGGKWPF